MPLPVTLSVDEDKSHALNTVYALEVFVAAVVTVHPIKSTDPVVLSAEITRLVIFRPSMVQPLVMVNVPLSVVFLPTNSCVVKTVY